MSKNALYAIIAVLVIGVGYFGWQYYEDQQGSSIELQIGDGGVKVETD